MRLLVGASAHHSFSEPQRARLQLPDLPGGTMQCAAMSVSMMPSLFGDDEPGRGDGASAGPSSAATLASQDNSGGPASVTSQGAVPGSADQPASRRTRLLLVENGETWPPISRKTRGLFRRSADHSSDTWALQAAARREGRDCPCRPMTACKGSWPAQPDATPQSTPCSGGRRQPAAVVEVASVPDERAAPRLTISVRRAGTIATVPHQDAEAPRLAKPHRA